MTWKIISSLVVFIPLAFGLTLNSNRPNRILVIVHNDYSDRPGQTTEEEFWEDIHLLDTVLISGKTLTSKYISELKSLKDTVFFAPNELDDFYHSFAFIIEHKNGLDTIYANPTLEYWKHNRRHFTDTSGILGQAFGNFFLY